MLDFYCPSERLAIELDGKIHETTECWIHDEERQKAIETLDVCIIRFRNDEVLEDLDQVLTTIKAHISS